MKNRFRNFYVLMCTTFCLFLSQQVFTQQTLTQINGWNAYVHLPANYSNTSITYPTIIFFPGIGEIGTNPAAVISNGPGAYIAQGWNGNVVSNGSTVEFIVISLQPTAGYPNEISLNEKIQTIKSLYRVNNNKLYLTGLSHGGWCSTTYVTGDPMGGPYTYASQIAAVVEVQGVMPDDNSPYPNLFDNFAYSGGRLLGFEQAYDNRGMPTRINRMNATKPNSGIYVKTNFGNGGHCCWNQFYGGQGVQPGIFLLDGVNQNLYEWLAKQSLGTAVNQPPVANAGADKIITLPVSSTTLNGSGTDVDGTIAAYLWTKISGPAAGTITNSTSANASVAGLTQGVYQYQFKVTDNSGNTNTDLMQVTVNAVANSIPTTNAGPDQTIVLPTSSANLNGSGNDADGSITSYAWTKLAGPAGGTISNANSAVTSVTGLTQGSYTFQLMATDNAGATAADNIIISVNAALTTCNSNAPVTYTIAQTAPGEIYRPNGSLWKGGDTLKITGTNYSVIEFNNIGGDACRPLVIMPMTTLVTPVFRFKGNCRYIKLWGGSTPYGIKINAGPLAISSSHHIEADNIEISGGSTGVYCKQDVVYADPMTWHPNYRMTKLTFKNLWIHDINGEGMYVGITQPSGLTVTSTFSGLDTVIVPIRLDSVEISNCIVERCTWDAIQLSNARDGNKIFNNTVRNYGTYNISSQQAGIILGGNTNGDVYNNSIIKGTGNGIQAFGYGVINIYGNTMDSCGYDGQINTNGTEGQQSVYASDYVTGIEVNPKQTLNVYNNIIKHPKSSGAIFLTGYFNNSNPSAVYNNSFCIPNAAGNWQTTYLRLLVAGSTNTNNTLSCAGNTNTLPVSNAGADVTLTLPNNSVTVTGTGTDANGTIASYLWSKIAGPSQGSIVSATTASTTINNLVQGVYSFVLTVTDNNGAIATDTMQVTVNAAITLLPAVNPANTVNGLDYKYYEGNWSVLPAYSSLTPVKTGTTVSFDLTPANRTSQFGFSFTGFITVPADGLYTFYTTSDDGSNLLIDNVLTVMNDGLHASLEKSGTIGLKAGKHAITGLYFEQGGDHIFDVSYEGMGISKQTIPNAAMFRIAAVNAIPVANAGNNISLTLPVNATNLTGSGTDADGTIASYFWTLLSGPAGSSITGSDLAVAIISNLVQGSYSYQLAVTDNSGAIGKDTINVTVNAASNQAPVANAGNNISLTLPVNTTNLTGSGTDADGSIVSYFWTLLSGPAGSSITGSNLAVAIISNLVQGSYSYQLAVTDNSGATGKDTINVTVNAASNQAPVANAGNNISLTLPVNTTNLTGSGTDADGSIVSYFWTLLSGPAGSSITGSNLAVATVSNLIQGSYSYQLAVTDNSGATGKDTINVTVNAAGNLAPIANAGNNISLTLPVNTTNLTGSGTDGDGSIVSYFWTLISGPAGSTLLSSNAAVASVSNLVQGTYTYQLRVTDNSGATATALTQVSVNPPVSTSKIIRVNVFGGTNPFSDTKWNNWNIVAALSSGNLLYEDRTTSSVNVMVSGDKRVVDNGSTYATGAVPSPANVLRYNSASTSMRTITINGLNPSKKYSIEFYASRASTGNKSVFAIGNKTDTINTDNNLNDYAKFLDVISNNAGTVSVNLNRVGTWNYLAGFSITEQADVAAKGSPAITAAPLNQVYQGETIVEMGANAVSVYPNPFVGSFKVQINNKAAGEYALKLSATSGQTVFYKKIIKPTAAIVETIHVNNLPAGTYILQIISVATGNKTVHKVIKN